MVWESPQLFYIPSLGEILHVSHLQGQTPLHVFTHLPSDMCSN